MPGYESDNAVDCYEQMYENSWGRKGKYDANSTVIALGGCKIVLACLVEGT
jgi:hypothetical protein